MRFVLFTPSSTSAGGQQQQIPTSSDLVTNTGGIHAAISRSPNPLKPKTQSTVNISFYDPITSNPLSNNDVKYDMVILDKNSHPVITKQDLTAKNATDTQVVTFPSNDIYQIQLRIKQLLKAGQTDTRSYTKWHSKRICCSSRISYCQYIVINGWYIHSYNCFSEISNTSIFSNK